MSPLYITKRGSRSVISAGMRGIAGGGPGGSGGVRTFNTRSGVVVLIGADVTAALGYTPANGASLAAVAFSGAYSALTGKPFIPTTAAQIGAATQSQGELAATAVQPEALTIALNSKVDRAEGYGLSQENFTLTEKNKLAGISDNVTAQLADLTLRLETLESSGGAPNGALTDGAGNVLVDGAGNTLIAGA
ncbi:hypothetical protein SAMN05216206_2757 [Pseudomonas guineae]|uniref:Uncharacterized protein n=1 Tax=Pseudomonas guineae TaxID=425504 RepID=A0A1I3K9I1_9PSED|nr:hypothetical protein [Pseudomonas guineae]SFI69133.1 hypothetical protein SAMN05216206_2757 [Pseudomonas guineae]